MKKHKGSGVSVTALPAPFVQLFSSALLALLVFGSDQVQPHGPAAAPPAVERLALEPGASVEREIRGGETQTFEIRLEARTFLFLEIKNRRMAVSSTIVSSRGEILAEGEGSEGLTSQLLAMIAERADTCRLTVTGRGTPRLSGRYRIIESVLRPAVNGDEDRVKGARALTDARRLNAKVDGSSGRHALSRLEESLAFWQAAGDARGEVEALVGIGQFYSDKGDPRAALSWYQKVIDRSRESGFLEGEAFALGNMGYAYSLLGSQDQAIESDRQSLEVWRRMGGPYELAYALNELAKIYLKAQDFDLALQTFEEARSSAEAAADLTLQATALIGAAATHYREGRLGRARELLEKALELTRQAADEKQEATIEQNLAAIYQTQGQFQKALDLLIRVAGTKPPKESGMMRYNMGNLYAELGDSDKALENYALSREVSRAGGNATDEVNALIGIGRVYQQQGKLQAALAEYEKARDLVPEEPWIVLHHIGLARIELGQLQEGVASLMRALEIARKSHDRSQEAFTLLTLGAGYVKLGQPDQAVESLRQAIALGSEIGYQNIVALAFLRRSQLRREQNRLEEALADVENGLAAIESTRRNIAGDQLRTGFFAAKRTYYDLDIDLLLQLDRLQPGKGYRAKALEASERARARGLLDLLAEGRIDLRQGLDSDLRQREDDLSDQISRVQRELRAGDANPARIEQLHAERDALDTRRQQLEVEIQAKNKRYAEVRYPVPLKLEEIQSRIVDGRTALLEYVLGDKSSSLFVVTAEGLGTYALPAAAEVEKLVLRLRGALEQESLLKRRDYLESAWQLYRDLLQPAAAAFRGKSRLLIVADGALNYIPFEALLTAPGDLPYRDLPYLLRQFSIAYLPSASVLAGLRQPRQEIVAGDRKQVVAFAPFAGPGSEASTRGAAPVQPSDSTEGRWSFKALPASGREIAEISGLYPGAALSFVGGAADEATVTRNPAVAAARRLHFATHAQIDERHPEYSALVLAERPGEDGLLQVREIFNLKLSADLAVLSACETALGKEVTGEGLMGMTRAFFYAGVPSLVVSLWNVVDGPTPDLMLDFYRNLDRMQDKAQALRVSKLSMIDHGKYSHPSYWAPFILLGEPR